MERHVRLEDISDGKLYGRNDLVKADCADCKGCSACCKNMGSSIVLDPYDVYRMEKGLNMTFDQLVKDHIELNLVDGLVLPNLKMAGKEHACTFLSEEGRCTIHDCRPGFCRIFPLGRFYENNSFKYFLQIHECKNKQRTKVKVSKWIDTDGVPEYEEFINQWHYFTKKIQNFIKTDQNEKTIKMLNLYILDQFYMQPFEDSFDFYGQCYARIVKIKQALGHIIDFES